MRDFFRRLEEEGVPWIRERTVPVYALDAARNIPLAHGTGVLLKIAGVGFLLSAAHVLRRRKTHTLLVFPTDSNKAINLNTMHMRVSRDERFVDVGIARLTPEGLAAIERHRPFLGLEHLELTDVPPPEGWYSVCGYPGSLTDEDLPAQVVTSTALYYCSELRGKPLASAIEGLTIAFDFAAESVDSDGEDADVPEPGGISGCGMWRMHARGSNSDEWSPASLRLVGIQHSVVSNSRKVPMAFRGTRIHCVVAWIWQEFEDMRAEIDRFAPGLGPRFTGPGQA
ncbi:MAG TPA: hypothetical protein VNO30_32900 [Kofleriaceae bacterium]|nr:hypothetical protein [Kofleriaceae bacterium]